MAGLRDYFSLKSDFATIEINERQKRQEKERKKAERKASKEEKLARAKAEAKEFLDEQNAALNAEFARYKEMPKVGWPIPGSDNFLCGIGAEYDAKGLKVTCIVTKDPKFARHDMDVNDADFHDIQLLGKPFHTYAYDHEGDKAIKYGNEEDDYVINKEDLDLLLLVNDKQAWLKEAIKKYPKLERQFVVTEDGLQPKK